MDEVHGAADDVVPGVPATLRQGRDAAATDQGAGKSAVDAVQFRHGHADLRRSNVASYPASTPVNASHRSGVFDFLRRCASGGLRIRPTRTGDDVDRGGWARDDQRDTGTLQT